MKRAALYARVSTDDKGQDPETQLMPLREFAQRRGFELAGEFVDHASGMRADRVAFQRMLTLVRRRQLDVVLVFRYSRFARSTKQLLDALDEFQSLGVDFISYTEGLDTTTPQGRLMYTMVAGLNQFERDLIVENVKAGMLRAKAQGKHTGRPSLSAHKRSEIERLLAEGMLSAGKIAAEVGVSRRTVMYVKKERQLA